MDKETEKPRSRKEMYVGDIRTQWQTYWQSQT